MANHWVQARQVVTRTTEAGQRVTYQPGDWFECRNAELLRLQAEGKILTAPDILRATFDFTRAEILWRGAPAILGVLGAYGIAERVARDPADLRLEREYTLIAQPGAITAPTTAALGFLRVEARDGYDAWDGAGCLMDGQPLARDYGSAVEQARTLAAAGDLRLPLYDTGLLWLRRTPATDELIAAWAAELADAADPAHAFARALYTRRVLWFTLPPRWVGAYPGP